MFIRLSGKSVFQEVRTFCLHVKRINSPRSLSNTAQREKWLHSARMCLNGQKSPWNVKLMSVYAAVCVRLAQVPGKRAGPWQNHTMPLCSTSRASVSMLLFRFHLSASVCLPGFLLLMMGNRFSWNVLETLFNSCPDNFKARFGCFLSCLCKAGNWVKIHCCPRRLQLLISHRKKEKKKKKERRRKK